MAFRAGPSVSATKRGCRDCRRGQQAVEVFRLPRQAASRWTTATARCTTRDNAHK